VNPLDGKMKRGLFEKTNKGGIETERDPGPIHIGVGELI